MVHSTEPNGYGAFTFCVYLRELTRLWVCCCFLRWDRIVLLNFYLLPSCITNQAHTAFQTMLPLNPVGLNYYATRCNKCCHLVNEKKTACKPIPSYWSCHVQAGYPNLPTANTANTLLSTNSLRCKTLEDKCWDVGTLFYVHVVCLVFLQYLRCLVCNNII